MFNNHPCLSTRSYISEVYVANVLIWTLFGEQILIKKLKVGNRVKIPMHKVFHQETGHIGKVVYISEDGKTVTVKCGRKHNGKTVAFNVAFESIE